MFFIFVILINFEMYYGKVQMNVMFVYKDMNVKLKIIIESVNKLIKNE